MRSDIVEFVFGLYLGLSLLTFLVYASDKRAARHQQRRVRERTLHLLALAGGWPGALLARRWLRHKSAKRSFSRVLWLTVLANTLLFAALAALHFV
jgi:uncharacterized membrane protein YsdA (DUF1294 family)